MIAAKAGSVLTVSVSRFYNYFFTTWRAGAYVIIRNKVQKS